MPKINADEKTAEKDQRAGALTNEDREAMRRYGQMQQDKEDIRALFELLQTFGQDKKAFVEIVRSALAGQMTLKQEITALKAQLKLLSQQTKRNQTNSNDVGGN